jgi:entericidin B
MKRIVVWSTLFLLPALTACNTMEGFGQDIQKGGQKIEKAADKNR